MVVRNDLARGVLSSQIVHAAGESAAVFGSALPLNTCAVVLALPTEADLLTLEDRLLSFKVPHFSIREPDFPYNNALMAIGFPPSPKGTFRKFLSNLPLLKEQL